MKASTRLGGMLLALLTMAAAPVWAEPLKLSGAGATFPAPLYERWLIDFREQRPDLTFKYEATGSGDGVKRFLAGTVDFGASDGALNDEELTRVDPERGVVMVPMTAGMVVLAYNIPKVGAGLRLPRAVYLDIFGGRISHWDDPRIVAANPDLTLPHKAIIPVVRRDSSGTTFIMTNHLGAADPRWTEGGPGIGKLVDWPGKAMTASGNAGVAHRVSITDGSIGYMEYEFAERLGMPVAILENQAGNWIDPDPAAGQAALASAGEPPEDLRLFIPDPAGADAYPIVGYSWILLYERYADPARAAALKDALTWALDEGQAVAKDLGYVPLPAMMVERANAALARVR